MQATTAPVSSSPAPPGRQRELPLSGIVHQEPRRATKHDLTELTALVKTRLKRMQYRPGLLVGFLVSSGLQYGPFL